MVALLLLLALLIVGIFSLGHALPLVIALPLIFVAASFAFMVSAEIWRRWRIHESARCLARLQARVTVARRAH